MAGVRQFDEDSAFEKHWIHSGPKAFERPRCWTWQNRRVCNGARCITRMATRKEIFVRVFERYTERFIADARKALNKPDLRNALTDFFTFAIRSITQGSPARGCLSTKIAVEIDPESPRQQELVMRMLDELEDVLFGVLGTPEARAQLIIPPRQAARLIVTMTRGIAVMERVYGEPKRLRQTALALVDTLVQQ